MKIILATIYRGYYWRRNGNNAPFPIMPNNEAILEKLDSINSNCPMIGIAYYKGEQNNYNFEYIKIRGVTKDINGHISVSYDFVRTSNTPSRDFEALLPPGGRFIFSLYNDDVLREILTNFNETLPDIGLQNLQQNQNSNISENRSAFLSYIGENYLKLLNRDMSDNEFEDRICELLIALGFEVDQKGYTVIGAYPDGYAKIGNTLLVYDCKNSDSFDPRQEDVNKMNVYIRDAKTINEQLNIVPVFISRGYNVHTLRTGYLYYQVNSLLYLLYKKLNKGFGFNLMNILRSITNNEGLSIRIIDNDF